MVRSERPETGVYRFLLGISFQVELKLVSGRVGGTNPKQLPSLLAIVFTSFGEGVPGTRYARVLRT